MILVLMGLLGRLKKLANRVIGAKSAPRGALFEGFCDKIEACRKFWRG